MTDKVPKDKRQLFSGLKQLPDESQVKFEPIMEPTSSDREIDKSVEGLVNIG